MWLQRNEPLIMHAKLHAGVMLSCRKEQEEDDQVKWL